MQVQRQRGHLSASDQTQMQVQLRHLPLEPNQIAAVAIMLREILLSSALVLAMRIIQDSLLVAATPIPVTIQIKIKKRHFNLDHHKAPQQDLQLRTTMGPILHLYLVQ